MGAFLAAKEAHGLAFLELAPALRSAQARFLAVSTNGDPDIVLYPDSGKLGAAQRLPEAPGGLMQWFRLADAVDYYADESAPEG